LKTEDLNNGYSYVPEIDLVVIDSEVPYYQSVSRKQFRKELIQSLGKKWWIRNRRSYRPEFPGHVERDYKPILQMPQFIHDGQVT
jgi:hypothetical protein